MHAYSIPLLRRALSAINTNDAEAEVRIVEARMCDPAFWSSPNARAVLAKVEAARRRLALAAALPDLDLYAEAAADSDLRAEAEAALATLSADAEAALTDPTQASAPALVTLTAGAGGEDARDFVVMTLRELALYAEGRGLTCEVIDESPEGGGLREATVRVSGPDAFRVMRGEAGKRRLVRQSPFGAGGRQTSFCGVSVLPEVSAPAFTVPASDLRFETYRDTGPGGQHRNTTDSAVRVTHLPTGLSAKSAMRSQHDNRKTALTTLMSRLEARFAEDRRRDAEGMREGAGDAGFGGHARTLVLDPYRLVRNEISGESSADVEGYLAGRVPDVRAPF